MNGIRHLGYAICSLAIFGVTSCDKVKELADNAKSWASDEEDKEQSSGDEQVVEVQSVDKAKGKDIIAKESRLVIVEYYSDT